MFAMNIFRVGQTAALTSMIVVALCANSTPAAASKGYSVPYQFCEGGNQVCPDGQGPSGGLVFDSNGNMFGTTEYGGDTANCNCGVVFEITTAGKEKVLYQFSGGSDGGFPISDLVFDDSGNMYGTTSGGGNFNVNPYGCGVFFKLAPDGTETVLHTFQDDKHPQDGCAPMAGVLMDKKGNFYGTTGGDYYASWAGGTIWKMSSQGKYKVLYTFCSQQDCPDGQQPFSKVLRDHSGNIYVNAVGGGRHETPCEGQQCGTVLKLAPDATATVLYKFCRKKNCTDGAKPYGSLVIDIAGNLYGVTGQGGHGSCNGFACGTIFKLTPDGTETVLYNFCSQANCQDGDFPMNGLTEVDDGKTFYGTTNRGGQYNEGVAFSFSAGIEKVLHDFAGSADNGAWRASSTLLLHEKYLYGETDSSDDSYDNQGDVFKLGTRGE